MRHTNALKKYNTSLEEANEPPHTLTPPNAVSHQKTVAVLSCTGKPPRVLKTAMTNLTQRLHQLQPHTQEEVQRMKTGPAPPVLTRKLVPPRFIQNCSRQA